MVHHVCLTFTSPHARVDGFHVRLAERGKHHVLLLLCPAFHSRSYCTAKPCPEPEAPPQGTLLEFLLDGEPVTCVDKQCPSGTQARYSCAASYAFDTHPTIRGGYKQRLCVNGDWQQEAPAACMVSCGRGATQSRCLPLTPLLEQLA